jgi:Putative zinc-finger
MTGPDMFYRETLSCDAVRRKELAYLDGQMSHEERRQMDRHMDACSCCTQNINELRELRGVLKAVPVRVPPPELHTQLRVVASRERSRRLSRASWAAWRADARLWITNLMRPLAIPTAGGFVSAVLLFGVLASSSAFRGVAATTIQDVPTVLYTEATVKSYGLFGLDDQDLVVELTVDEQGRMLDYSIPNAEHLRSAALRRNIENNLLLMHFYPATTFGQPTPGKVRLWFRTSRIDVKG